jgi:hypothetical protein
MPREFAVASDNAVAGDGGDDNEFHGILFS